MTPATVLHIPTLLLLGQLMLLLLGAAMLNVQPLPGEKRRVLLLWVAAMWAMVLPGALDLIHLGLSLSPDPLVAAPVTGALTASAALRCMALLEVRGPGRPRAHLLLSALAFGAVAASVTTLQPAWRSAVIGMANILVPVLGLPALRHLARQNAGGKMTAVAVLLSALPSALNLADMVSPGREDLSLLLLGDLLAHFGAGLGLLLWHQGRIHQLLSQAAVSDALTGALNRHGVLPQLEQELARAERGGRPVSVVLCDLDHFKRVNDTHGHAVGDQVLKHFVARASRLLRKGDMLGRWGGEEFLFVLPDTATREAVQTLERLRRQLPLTPPGVPAVTFSAGVATSGEGGIGYSKNELLNCADRRLYIAKETRDRVVPSLPMAVPSANAG
jgi:diguanylate cyclase (GGDEF)-like protein